MAKWTATADYLTEAIENVGFEIVPLDFEQIYPTVEAGEVDFVIANSSFYVNLEARYGAGRIATLKNLRQGKVCTTFGGAIFTKTDSGINKLTDLKGKRFMAVEKTSFGGWQMAWRELKVHGIDPHKDFADLLFGGTHDAVVYAVRDGKVDAGTVRTDTLGRMEAEGKIDIDDYEILFGRDKHIHIVIDDDACRSFPFAHSTRSYPEWPFAKTAETPDEIAEKVTAALLSMPADSDAAKAARCAGWTIPHNYTSVHDCLRKLRVAPYEDYGKVSTVELIRQYWLWLLGAAGVILTVVTVAIRARKLNIELGKTIAQRKQAKDELRVLYELSSDAVMRLDEKGFFDCNPATVKMFGCKNKEEFCSKHPSDISPATQPCGTDSMELANKRIATAMEEGSNCFEWVHRRIDGTDFPADVLLNAIELDGKQVQQAVVRDITERKQAEESIKLAYEELETAHKKLKGMQSQIVQNEKLASIGQLAAGVAHEMNTPVGFVASNFQALESYVEKIKKLLGMYDDLIKAIAASQEADLLSKAAAITESRTSMNIDFLLEDIQGLFDDSREGLERVTQIVQNLRDFSRIDQPGSLDEYDLNRGLEATLVVAANEIKYDANVKTEFSRVPSIRCNSGQINQVLLNILMNAAQAIRSQEREDRGTVTLRTYATESEIVCEISDDGPGISADHQAKIFDPFFTTKPVG
ncbi:MAG: PhnD/SsuA/transferrin family substrate-binding protein, partial [Planctomycetota bacterium]|nr:PhnD/SsuA/transferrin family substrate-binding protein [Planctomycetota bacterium]